MNERGLFLFLHLLGVVLWLGLSLVLPFVTGRAAREGRPTTVAFAYRVSDRLMRTLGLAGMLLTLLGGIGLTAVQPSYGWFRPFPDHWLFQMQLLGIAAFLVGVLVQLPLGRRLAREAEALAGREDARSGAAPGRDAEGELLAGGEPPGGGQLPHGGEPPAGGRARDAGDPEAFTRLRKRHALVGSVTGLVLLILVVLGTLRPM